MRALSKLLLILLCLSLFAVPCSAIGLSAKAGILMDVNSGEVLYGKNIHQRLPIASLTKIMTALLAAESGKLDDIVTVHPGATKVEPSAIWFVPGEKISLSDLVYGLMLRSGNDAALAIAYYLAESVDSFSEMMNAKAVELGAHNTKFRNPHGLSNQNHFSTAYDLALITRAALLNPFVHQVVAVKRYESPWEGHNQPRVWHNKNRLLQLMSAADGVKTGWTQAAGHCLASSATKGGWQLLGIVLDSPDHYGENRALLEWGFKNFHRVDLVTSGVFQGYVPVKDGKPSSVGAVTAGELKWVAKNDENLDVGFELFMPLELGLPVSKGQFVGQLTVRIGGKEVARIPLMTDQASTDKSWLRKLLRGGINYIRFVHGSLQTLV
ncbi:MAG: D-alanyl-D-alanine carboxypeptidase (penicillin-binding protein 5/6) [Bacillota bacterium]|nr:MAG: D-alanyl-D-alanine carboxypeptidase (penicillin-binding protein 5/6) [Bacillota bacterium]